MGLQAMIQFVTGESGDIICLTRVQFRNQVLHRYPSVFTGSVRHFAELQAHIHLISGEGRVIETNIDHWPYLNFEQFNNRKKELELNEIWEITIGNKQAYIQRRFGIQLTRLTQPRVSVCPKPELGFQTSYAVVGFFILFS